MSTDNWANHVAIAVTVTDANGIITEMNPASIAVFAADGGAELIGSDVLACHPEPSRTKLASMYKAHQSNHYTIRKNGQRKIIHQVPLLKRGCFRGTWKFLFRSRIIFHTSTGTDRGYQPTKSAKESGVQSWHDAEQPVDIAARPIQMSDNYVPQKSNRSSLYVLVSSMGKKPS